MLIARRVLAPALASILLAPLALGAATGCKVEVQSSTQPDEAKPNSDDATTKPVDENAEDVAEDAAEGAAEGAAEAGSEGDAPADPGSSLSAAPATCEGGHKAGDSWPDDCNTCRCTETGEIACTRMACQTDPE